MPHGLVQSHMFSSACRRLHFLHTCHSIFPALSAAYTFSRALRWIHIFPHLSSAACFPPCRTGEKFPRNWHHVGISPTCDQAICVFFPFNVSVLWLFLRMHTHLPIDCFSIYVATVVRKPYYGVVTIRSVFYMLSHSKHYDRLLATGLLAYGQTSVHQ